MTFRYSRQGLQGADRLAQRFLEMQRGLREAMKLLAQEGESV